MSEEAGFLEALAETPGDESTRLALADWLLERSDPREPWVRDADLFRWTGSALQDPLPGLIAALGDRDTWEVATRGLVKLGVRVLPLLLDSLRTGSDDAREHARVVLGMLGPVAAKSLPKLQQQLSSENLRTRRAAVDALQRLGPAAAPALPRLLELLEQGDVDFRVAVVRALAAMKHLPASALPALQDAWYSSVSDEDEDDYDPQSDYDDFLLLHDALVDAFATLGPAALEVVPELVECFTRRSPGSAESAAGVLSGLGLDVAEPLLAEVHRLQHDEHLYAVNVLENLGAGVIPLLLRTLANPESSEQAKEISAAALREPRLREHFGEHTAAIVERLTVALKDSSFRVRMQSARTLGEIGEAARSAIGTLAKLVKDKYAGSTAAAALAQLGAAGAGMTNLETEVRTGKAEGRRRAVEALRELASTSDEALPPLLRALRDRNAQVRSSAAFALASTMKPHWTTAIAPLRKALADADEMVRRHTATALGNLGPAAEITLPELLARVGDRSEDVRRAIVEALARIAPGSSAVLAALRSAVDDPSGSVRCAAIRGLRLCPGLSDEVIGVLADRCLEGNWNVAVEVCYLFEALEQVPDSAVQAIRRILREGDHDVRSRVADTVRQMTKPPAGAIPELLLALEDDDYHVGIAAAGALAAMGAEGFQQLASRLADANKQTRQRASSTLAYSEPLPVAILPALLAAAKKPGAEMRKDMAHALGNVVPHAKEALAALVKFLDDKNAEVRQHALEGLGRFGAEAHSALPQIARRLADESSSCRCVAIEALGKMEAPEAVVPYLRQALGDFHGHVRSLAVQTLSAMGSAAREALADLRAREKDEDEYVRQQASEAVAKIEAGE
jgi:uncharacterized protein (TIGR02996 family)